MVERGSIFSPAILIIFVFISLLPERSQTGIMITKPGSSDKDCARRCKEENEIDCRYFKFHKVKMTCFLSPTNDSSISRMRKIHKPPLPPGTKPASSWISELQSRVLLLEKKENKMKEMRKDIEDLRTELTALKNSRALTHHVIRTTKEMQDKNMEAINEKADLLKSEVKRMEDAIMTLGELQRSFGKKVTKINEDRKSTSLSMAMLGQSNKDIKSSVRELSSLSTQVQQSISDIRKEMTDMEVRFAGLSTDVMEKSASLESMVGPELKEMQATQTNLAQALSMITKKILILSPRIPQLHRLVTTNDGMVAGVAKKVQQFHREIEQLTGRVEFTEGHLRKFVDPASKISQERRLLISQLREEVVGLRTSQKRLQNDVLMEISDRTRLYKELSQIKLSKKMTSNALLNLREKIQKMDKDIRNVVLNGPQGDLISKILHRQVAVLKKMKIVQQDQGNMKKDLGKFNQEIRDVSDLALDARGGWNRTENLAKINRKISSLKKTIGNATMTKKTIQKIKKMEERLKEGLEKVNKTQRDLEETVRRYNLGLLPNSLVGDRSYPVPVIANTKTVYDKRQMQRERQDLDRLRAQTNTLSDLAIKSINKDHITDTERARIANLVRRNHRRKQRQKLLAQHQYDMNRAMDNYGLPLSESELRRTKHLRGHLENLHNVLANKLARQEQEQE